jgi:LmbE family N-acetylglucosaminyl deacetylase
MRWIYLSPHLDDAALSCGGLIWEQGASGEPASIWTICAGDPPEQVLSPFAESLHARWGTGLAAAEQRRQEDLRSCARIKAECVQLSIPDCIYRQHPQTGAYLYACEEAIIGPLHPAEAALVEELSAELARRLPGGSKVVAPLALGGHVDHRLVRAAAEQLALPADALWYYADYPYVLQSAGELDELRRSNWQTRQHPVSAAALSAWQASIAAHASQISTFWPDLGAMEAAMRAYWAQNQGVLLWKKGD